MNYEFQLKEKACTLAQSLLKSDAEYLDNVIELSSIGNSLYKQCWDTEFHIFCLISSETDHLPTQKVRQHCAKSMLEKSDNDLKKIIEYYKKDVERACDEIISKHKGIQA